MIALCVVVKPLDTLNPMPNSMQDPTCDFVKASEHAIALLEVYLHKPDDVLYYDEKWKSAITLENQQNVALQSKNSWSPTTWKYCISPYSYGLMAVGNLPSVHGSSQN